jgi:L-2,4-diaminobutyric acid acetyltransferase
MFVSRQPSALESEGVRYRSPRIADAASVHGLVDRCKPLDLNSPYAYLLLCAHFAETCAVGDAKGSILGFVGGYLKPSARSVFFVWQIAVSQDARGRGVGKRLLQEVLARQVCENVRYLETTVTPSNDSSRALFESFARSKHADCVETTLFRSEDFGAHDHDEERLLRIGPLRYAGREE